MKRVLQDAGIRAVAGMVLIAVAGCNYSPGQPGEKQTPTTVAAAHPAAKPADNPAAHPAAAQRQPAPPRASGGRVRRAAGAAAKRAAAAAGDEARGPGRFDRRAANGNICPLATDRNVCRRSDRHAADGNARPR